MIGTSMTRFVYLVLLLICLCFHLQYNMGVTTSTNSIVPGQQISFSDTIVSSGGMFELGFFSPENSSNYYVGIWYKTAKKTVVWVANRNFALTVTSGVLKINPDGNLVISDQQLVFMMTNTSSKGNTSAVLLDSGNLVLKDSNSAVLWQSFGTPTHVFLPGMKIGINKRSGTAWSLVSWRSTGDPESGAFSLKLDEQNRKLIIMQGSQIYWVSGSWNAEQFSLVPGLGSKFYFNISYTSNEVESYISYSLDNSSMIAYIVMDVSGQIKVLTWLDTLQEFYLFWSQPKLQCEVYLYGFCGSFGVCDQQSSSICRCLSGFEPHSSEDWQKEDRSGGCMRKIPLQCEDTTATKGNEDKFVKMSSMKYPSNARLEILSGKECMLACLSNCSCSAYAYNGSGGCSIWSGDILNLQQLSDDDPKGDKIYIRLAASALQGSGATNPMMDLLVNKKLLWVLVPVVVCFLLGCYFSCRWWNKRKLKGRMEPGEDILMFDMNISTNAGSGKSNESGLPLFSFSSVSAATNNFSPLNKLGEGGFGPVYKGKLLKGYEIAVKRLSKRSGQGLEELRNEAVLIAKLQHRNLVKLLGCCLEQEEKILIYEYMPNKSLDNLLFDPIKRSLLDWKTRVRVVEGIAQGLLYLHQYSRLKIIHRDLKASNILLDTDMNPKISDFGLARIFGGNESEANTSRIAGTYGYMSPEYALEGIFSVKSDVFSFGVLLLEIVSGKKNTGFYQTDSVNLLGYAWDLWKNNRALDVMDPVWEDESSKYIAMRYIHVAFLCVQEFAADRPAMFEVVSMLTNVGAILSSPKEPAFSTLKCASMPEVFSINEVTLSLLDAR